MKSNRNPTMTATVIPVISGAPTARTPKMTVKIPRKTRNPEFFFASSSQVASAMVPLHFPHAFVGHTVVSNRSLISLNGSEMGGFVKSCCSSGGNETV